MTIVEKFEFNIASFTAFKDSYKREVIQNNIGKTKYEIDVILEEMYIAYINKELNVNVSTLKDAKGAQIKAWQKIYRTKYYKINQKMERDRRIRYYKENTESCKESGKKWYKKNKEKMSLYSKNYYTANKAQIDANSRKFREEHPDYYKEYYEKNKERINDRCRKRYHKLKKVMNSASATKD